MEWILQLPVLFFSVIFHEFAHGYTAFRRGDDTAYLSGRLTFNPLPHIDPVGTILLPVACALMHIPSIGWAKPVPVNPYRLRHPRSDMALVAVSGPASNLILVLAAALLSKAVVASGLAGSDLGMSVLQMLSFGIIINLALAIFNLIPIFPLDGSQILLGVLKGRALEAYERHIPYGMYIVLGLVMLGLVKFILLPPLYLALALLAHMGVFVGF